MNDHQLRMIASLEEINATTEVLIKALDSNDLDKSHEAISIMLLQGMDFFGPQSPAMQQFFPVWDRIRAYIDSQDLLLARGQTEIWHSQLKEIIAIVRNG